MCTTYPIKGDATKVRLNFRGLKLVIKPNLNKNSPISEWKRMSAIFQESEDTKIYKSSPGKGPYWFNLFGANTNW